MGRKLRLFVNGSLIEIRLSTVIFDDPLVYILSNFTVVIVQRSKNLTSSYSDTKNTFRLANMQTGSNPLIDKLCKNKVAEFENYFFDLAAIAVLTGWND